ncbi:hypothetical protein [Lentzea flava]|uniref:Secreted protein n=1 Tax=Lentzea flava TaxID=103732 RepID=A0ABQ2UUX3_9PSEU|nr:hypothetical protein [Lentzea flava]MCP2200701.1 hypothetical protein [Lentzea flava]GGU54957.1 hypothetical protein GCM10010178_54220 [Lentzea flava]
MNISRIGGLVAGMLLLGAGTASAQEPITSSPEKVQKICSQRVPRVEQRVKALTDRINGSPETLGSKKWIEQKAADARSAGNTARADVLDARLKLRDAQLVKLSKAAERVAKFKSEHCGSK